MIGALLLVLATASAALFDEAPPDVRVERVTTDRVEHVWAVGDVVVRLRKSPGPDEVPTEPRCAAGGADLFVEGTPDDAEAAAIASACRRLRFEAPALASAAARYTPGPPPSARPSLRAWAALWILALVVCAPRAVAPWALAALGLLVRLALPTPRILMGVAYPYERMLVYAGLKAESALYGVGWPATMDLLRPVFGAHPEGVHGANLALSTLTIPFAWEAGRRLSGEVRVAHAAGALAAVLPTAVALSGTEELFVLAALLQTTALAGLGRGGRTGGALAALSLGLLANVRPLQVPMALVGVGWLAARGQRLAALAALVPIGLRMVAMTGVSQGPPWGWSDLERTLLHPVGGGSQTVLLDPWVTPFWLVPLALVGAVEGRRRGWPVGWLLAVACASWLPYLGFGRVPDLLRFQLPTLAAVGLLAAMAAPTVRRAGRPARCGSAVIVLAGLALAREPLGGRMVHEVEHAFLRAHVCALPAGTVVRYDAAEDPQGSMARWVEVVCGVRLRRLDGVPAPGEHLLVGRANRAPDGRPPPDCEVEVLAEQWAEAYNGGLHPLGDAPVRLALLRVVSCEEGGGGR